MKVFNTSVNMRIESNGLMTSIISFSYRVKSGGLPGVKTCEGPRDRGGTPWPPSAPGQAGETDLEADHFIPM